MALITGPCKLVPNEGRLGGYMTRGFILLFINISMTILMKGLPLALGTNVSNISPDEKNWQAASWILLNLVPQFCFVSYFQCASILFCKLFSVLIMKLSTQTRTKFVM